MPPDEENTVVEERLECSCCGTNEDVVERDHDTNCNSCEEEYYYTCFSCSHHGHTDDSYIGGNDEYYCSDCYYDYWSNCSRCGEVVDNDYIMFHDDESYCEHCCPDYRDTMVMDNKSVPSSSRVSDTFVYPIRSLVGLEVECIVPDSEEMDTPMYWSNVSDGSINTEGSGMGTELVSTPASGDLLMENINNLMRWKDYYGAWVNRSCGFHVHFNSIDKTPREVAHIAIVYQKFQDVLKSMMPDSRQDSNWCRDSTMNLNALRNVDSEEALIDEYYESMDCSPSSEKYNDARYCGINIHSRYYHGTIEFRLHSGTINKEKITNWISILNCIMLKGVEISSYSNEKYRTWVDKNTGDEGQLDRTFGLELLSYIHKRQAKFGGTR
tara:strand:- start:5775 stop:6920 length:1146 start_codon:yes stop_codon:yes gene_type:complete